MIPNLTLLLLDGLYAVCRMPLSGPLIQLPPVPDFPAMTTISVTSDELSYIGPADSMPDNPAELDVGWRCFRVDGDLPFNAVGVVASFSSALAQAGISLFAISTHDRDYFLVREAALDEAISALEKSLFRIEGRR